MRHTLTVLLVALVVLAAAAGDLRADGVYFPEPAYPAAPQIPVQRALIVHRDGVETLVVESALKSDSLNVGWVLPLPAEPTKLDVADGDMLTSLSISVRPSIVNDLKEYVEWSWLVLAILLPFAAVIIFISDRSRRVRFFLGVCLLELVGFCILLPGLATSLGSNVSFTTGIVATSTTKVGSYDVTVLHAADPQALSKWLTDNGLAPLTAKAQPIVTDYIARGWCFAVARLARKEGGAATPHPIAVTFPAAAPVYPMKLTALAGSTTHVELFVVTPDRQAIAAGFVTILADRYKPMPSEGNPLYIGPGYQGTTTKVIIGSPEAQAFLWKDCVFTKLTADLAPLAMASDIEIGLKPLVPQQKTYFSEKGRREVMTLELLIGGAVVAIVAAIIFRGLRRPSHRQGVALATVGGLTMIIVLMTYFILLVIPTRVGSGGDSDYHAVFFAETLKNMAESRRYEEYLCADLTPAQWAEFPKKATEKKNRNFLQEWYVTNPLTGELMKYERTPGNFCTRQIGNDCYFCLYDLSGREYRVKIEPRAKPKAAD